VRSVNERICGARKKKEPARGFSTRQIPYAPVLTREPVRKG